MRARSTILPLAVATLAALAAGQSFTPVNPDPGGVTTWSHPHALNSAGTLVGSASFGFWDAQPALWDATGAHQLPLLPPYVFGSASGVNEQNQIVGQSATLEITKFWYIIHGAATWWKNGEVLNLSTLVTGGAKLEFVGALDIDEHERIVGVARVPGGGEDRRGFLFEGGFVTDLGDLNPGGSATTDVAGFGANGAILGSSTAPTTFPHAFVWQDGVMTDLHDFAQIPGPSSHAYDANAQGVICGSGDFDDDDLFNFETAALWDHGTIVDLGGLAPNADVNRAGAMGINDLNQVVGWSQEPTIGQLTAFLWQDGVMVDLNTLLPPGSGWTLLHASDIANDGRIIGQGFFAGQPAQLAFLLVPDCQGGYTPYAAGCAGTAGFVPALTGFGCPAPGQPIGLALEGGLGGAPGALAVGLGQGQLPISPLCSASIAPLTSIFVPFVLDGLGAGAGKHLQLFALPPGLGPVTVSAQAGIRDFGGPGGISATNALSISIR